MRIQTKGVTGGPPRRGRFAYASQPYWRIPLADGIGHLSVAERGIGRDVWLNGVFAGTSRRATFAEPWTEFPIERDGHTIVVAQVFGLHRLAMTQEGSSTAQVFVDGINVRDREALTEWRFKSSFPVDRYAVATRMGFRGTGQHLGRIGVVVFVGLGLAIPLLLGFGPLGGVLWVVFMALAAAWSEGLAVIQDYLLTRHDWTFWKRMAIFMGSFWLFVVPIGVLAWTTFRSRSTSKGA